MFVDNFASSQARAIWKD